MQNLNQKLFRHLITAIFFASCSLLAKPSIEINPDISNGSYKAGEKISWTIKLVEVKAEDAKQAHYTVVRCGLDTIKKGKLDLSSGSGTISASMNKPGSLILTVFIPIEGRRGPLKKSCGAIVDINKIRPSMEKPNDFDSFWKEKLREQAKVPMNAQLTPEKQVRKNVDTWLVTLDTIKGQNIRGRLAKKSAKGKYPAIIIFQWAGIYGLDPFWSANYAKDGWLTFNVMAHDIPIDKDKAFYKKMSRGKLKGYTDIGSNDREKSYFLRMLLATSRAVDYISQHPEWDGKTIVVKGTSQGGLQSIAAAGLNNKVTAVMTITPAGCDHTAPLANRAIGWPYFLHKGIKDKAKLETSRYFDAVNFASNIMCPTLIMMGSADETARPDGVIAMISNIKGPVENIMLPASGHGGPFKGFRKRERVWQNSLLKTGKAPIK